MSSIAASVPSHSLPWMLLEIQIGVLYCASSSASWAAAAGSPLIFSRHAVWRAVSSARSGAVTVTR